MPLHGATVSAPAVDNDGHLDLYVTNWGSNLLFRNRGDGAFEEIAGQAGVAAGGWSTGYRSSTPMPTATSTCVARYVETTWDSVVRAQRTLLWRNGPRIMVGPADLPGEPDLFFVNFGNGRFGDATDAWTLRPRGCLRLRRPSSQPTTTTTRRSICSWRTAQSSFLYWHGAATAGSSAGLLAGSR